VLGLRPVLKWSEGAYLLAGEFWIALSSDQKQPCTFERGYSHVAFSVELFHFEKLSERIKASGAKLWQENQKKTVPDGEYLVNLEWWNQKQTIWMKVESGVAEVIKSSDPKLDGTTGTFQPLDDGGLYIFLKNDQESFGGQIWRLQGDGSFEIKEIPDRGEEQRAILAPQNF
jgi:hypothetical protein